MNSYLISGFLKALLEHTNKRIIFLKKLKSFSLIEILISLIIISLLVAAFTPIITKKLKASDISIGSFGSGSNVNMTLERQVTKEDCDKYGALFIPAAMNGGTRNLCVTKYNMGDKDLPLADSVKKLSVGQTCNDHLNCCWSGKTSSTCSDSNGDGDYSACNRTVCGWVAANASCASYAPNNENEGHWRLPTMEEFGNWSANMPTINVNKGKNGLQLCTHLKNQASIDGVSVCKRTNANTECTDSGFANNYCHGYFLWSSENYNAYHYTDGKFQAHSESENNYAFGARCVLDSIAVDISELPSGGGIKDPTTNPFYGEPKDQADCDKIVAIFIDKKMSGANRNICVSKYNVGDAGPDGFGPPVPQNYTQYIMSIGQACPYLGSCCWRGKTAGTCGLDGNAGANYSSCNRTVCQWDAANAACRQYNAFGATAVGAWRLPKSSEISVWAQHLNEINSNKGAGGLQLCFEGATSGAQRCTYVTNCINAAGNHCMPGRHWSETDTTIAFTQNLGVAAGYSSYHALTARCVYDGITKADNYAEDLDDYDDSNAPKDEPKSQADCDKLTAIFIHKKYTGGFRNICMSKYNVGDSGPSGSGPTIPSTYRDYVINTGQACPNIGFCCWKGDTAGNCSFTGNPGANYSSCGRTVCQWMPANESCKAYTAGGKTPVGSWRLPTDAEYSNLSLNLKIFNNDRGKDGTQLCFEGVTPGVQRCTYVTNCINAAGNHCMPGRHWSQTSTTTAFTQNLSSAGGYDHNYALTARCVYDGSTRSVQDASDYDDSNAPSDEPKSQADCEKLTSIFIHKKYTGSSRNICVTKYNVGDSGPSGSGPLVPSELGQLITVGQACSKAGYCCWKGVTGANCGLVGNATANYSSCNRTVCQFHIANSACKAHTAGGKTQAGYWRLPTVVEIGEWAKYLDIINNNIGKDGLQLCFEGITPGVQRCTYVTNCINAAGNHCMPGRHWSGTSLDTAFTQNLVSAGGYSYAHAMTARCVYDGTKAE